MSLYSHTKFLIIDELDDTLSNTVIHKVKEQFARHCIPEIVFTDVDRNLPTVNSNPLLDNGSFITLRHLPDTEKLMAKWRMPSRPAKTF